MAGGVFGLAADELTVLGDEFSDPRKLAKWKNFADVEGLPNRIGKMDVNQTSPGHLYLEPLSAAWWRGYHGVFLFKMIEGDFVATARVWVKGRSGDVPAVAWTISGLMARNPGDLTRKPAERERGIFRALSVPVRAMAGNEEPPVSCRSVAETLSTVEGSAAEGHHLPRAKNRHQYPLILT